MTAVRLPNLGLLGFALVLASLLPLEAHCQIAATDYEALGAKASAARDSGNAAEAISLYQRALALNPRWQDGWWFLGNLQYGTDQYSDARDSLSTYIRLLPDATAAFALRGLCEFEIGQYDASLGDIQHALSLGAANQDHNKQILLYHEAILLTRQHRFEEATAKYAVFIKDGIVNPDVFIGLGLAGLRMPILPAEMKQEDADLVGRTGEAALAIFKGDIAGGRGTFKLISAAYPKRPFIHYFCGYLVFPTDPDAAISEFKLELQSQPKSSMAHAMVAWISELHDDFHEALPYAQKAAEEEPDVSMNQLVLGRALVETSDVPGGLTHLDRAVQMEPRSLEAHLSLARTYSKLGRKEDARRERLLCLEISGIRTATVAKP